MSDFNGMHDDDNMDGSAPIDLGAHLPNSAVQDEEDGDDKEMVQDEANTAPVGPPRLNLGGEWDDCQGVIEYIANDIDIFGDDLLAFGDGDLFADGEVVASSTEQGIFSLDATSPTVTMSSLPEATAPQPSVSVAAAAVGITAPEVGREDPSRSLHVDNTEVFAPVGVAVATTSGDHGALYMPSASETPTTSSRAVLETTVAEIAASDPSKFICDAPSSVEFPVAIGSPGGGVSGASKTPAAAKSRYLAKRKRRRWAKTSSSYKSRQQVANSRPRHKGGFLPLQSEFVPIAELQRRQRMQMKEIQERAARPNEN